MRLNGSIVMVVDFNDEVAALEVKWISETGDTRWVALHEIPRERARDMLLPAFDQAWASATSAINGQ